MKLAGFLGSSYTLRAPAYECQRTVNMYPEKDEMGTGKEQQPEWLSSVPGQTLLHSLPQGPIRALYFTANGFIYCVAGSGLYQIITTNETTFTHLLLATLATSTGQACIQDGVPNQYLGIANTGLVNQVVVVDGSTTGFCFQEGTTLVYPLNSSNGYPGSQYVTFQDGFFLFSQPGTISAFYAADPLNISDLDIINANLVPDQISRVISDHDIIWIFGNRFLSIWQNTGGGATVNVFQQIPGAAAEGGCNAPGTITKCSGQLVWTTNDDRGYGAVLMASGYRGVRISNHAVEDWLQSFPDISGAMAWTYQAKGHSFYCLNVPGASSTWCYDFMTQQWCERCFSSNGSYQRDRIQFHANVYISGMGSIPMTGDYQNGNLYKLDESNNTFNGIPIRRERTAPHISESLERLFYNQLQVDVLTGQGIDGLGFPVQSGIQATPTALSASNVLMANLGNNVYQLLGNDGNAVIPTGSVTVSAVESFQPSPNSSSSNWSQAYTFSAINGQVTITTAPLLMPYTQFGVGNGTQVSFQLANLINKVVSASEFSIILNDWRGNNLQQVYPAMNTNLNAACYDFNYSGIWSIVGANSNGTTLWTPPDGSQNASLLSEDTSTGSHYVSSQYRVPPVTTTIGFSVYAKQVANSDSKRYVTLQVGQGLASATFDLTLGSVTQNFGATTATATAVSPGVYRLFISTTDTGSGNLTIYGASAIYLSNTGTPSGYPTYTGDGQSYVGIWGVQVSNSLNGAGIYPPLIQTDGLSLSDYVIYEPILGNVTFNLAPYAATATTSAALASIEAVYLDTSVFPTEYTASFNYSEYLPNMVNVATDPQVILSYSDDHGYSFSAERYASMGRLGNRVRRCIWRKLGQSRDRVFRIVCTDPVPFGIIGAEIAVKKAQVYQ